MSLQLAAQHLSHQGRGNDSMLIHMSPREIKGLNDLAMAHGGHLTTNPHTGLPEAGFLESILPMVAGFALNAAVPGLGAAMGGFAIPALVGGGTALLTGSLGKGLMAGLGAYGGANMGSALAETATVMDPNVVSAQNAVIENAKTNFYEPAKALTDPSYASNYATDFAAKNESLAKNLLDARAAAAPTGVMDTLTKGVGALGKEGGFSSLYQNMGGNPMSMLKTLGSAAAPVAAEAMKPKTPEEQKGDSDMGQRYGFSMNPTGGQQQVQPGQDPLTNTRSLTTTPFPIPDINGREQHYFSPSYSKLAPEEAKKMYGYADGGVATDPDRPTETPALQMFKQMQAQRAAQPPAPQIDANAEFIKYAQQTLGTPNQMQAPTAPPPTSTSLGEYGYTFNPIKQQLTQIQGTPTVTSDSVEDPLVGVNPMSGQPFGGGMNRNNIMGNAAGGSISDAGYNLGEYSDGGRLLRGPGDGVSDSIPAVIGKKQPARLADGEFVIPARIVSELGNGSTEAGARKLYAMMDRIQSARGKTVGKNKVAKNSRSEKYLPA